VRGVTNVVVRLPAGRASDRLGRRLPLIAAYAAIVVVNLLIARPGGLPIIALSLLLYGLAWGTRAVSEWAYLADVVRPEVKTVAFSYLSTVFGIGSMLGSILTGALSMALPYGDIFLLSSLLNLPSIPMILKMRSPQRSSTAIGDSG
jgi:MFS family permease